MPNDHTNQLLLLNGEAAEPTTVRWESRERYYAVTLQLDLLGDWVLTIARGGKRNRLGTVQHKLMAKRETGELEIAKLDRRRSSRGYLRVDG